MSSAAKLPVVILACKVMEAMISPLLPDDWASSVTFLDYGLHRTPAKMSPRLQEIIDAVPAPSLIVLGYGLCGNGLKGLRAGDHTLLVPRTDDCIAVLLGSRAAYHREFNKEPGTYYLSKGWLESGSNPLNEYREYVERYGEEDAQWIMDTQYQNYKRLVLVTQNDADLATYRPQALEVAEYCSRWGMRYEEIVGSNSYVERLLAAAANLEDVDDDFLVIPPGGEIRLEDFI